MGYQDQNLSCPDSSQYLALRAEEQEPRPQLSYLR